MSSIVKYHVLGVRLFIARANIQSLGARTPNPDVNLVRFGFKTFRVLFILKDEADPVNPSDCKKIWSSFRR